MKYFFFDIDGTIAVGRPGKQYVPESTQQAIQKLKEAGHFVAIATGRSAALASDYMHQLGFENMVSDGGNYQDVVVFGDGLNDLSMFIDEWTSISMGNAVDELKEKASYITDDANKDGIYKACQHFGWID